MSEVATRRVLSAGRLAWYRAAASSDFWDDHWEQHFNPSIYDWADGGDLGYYDSAAKRFLPRQGRILEAGCGLAQYVLAMRKNGFDVEGVDFAARTVALVQQHRPDIPVSVGDVTSLAVPDGHYAGYISLGVVEHLENGPEPILREAYRVLAPGGTGIITVPWMNALRTIKARLGVYDRDPGDLVFYQYAFPTAEFEGILGEIGFEILHHESYDPFKGLKDEWPLLARLRRHRRYGALLEAKIRSAFAKNDYLAQKLGHMLLVVVRKPA